MKTKTILLSCALAAATAFADKEPLPENDPTLTLMRELIVRPSFSANVEDVNKVVDYMADWLREHKLYVTVEAADDGRKAIWASTVPGKKAEYCLSCHLDTVPCDESMLKPVMKGERMYARGAWDCKGHSAACANILARLVGTGASVGCVFNADEEVGGSGAGMMVKRGYGATKMVLVVDGSLKTIVTAHKCQTVYKLIARGRSGHSSAPWAWDNALTKLMRACVKLEDAWKAERPRAKAGDEWHDTIAITMAHGGTAPNNIPDYAEATINLRGITKTSDVETLEFIKRVTGLEVIMERSTPPVVTDPTDPNMVALRKAMDAAWPKGHKTKLQRLNGATDARHFVALGVPIAIFGADGRDAHCKNESMDLRTLLELVEMLVKFLTPAA